MWSTKSRPWLVALLAPAALLAIGLWLADATPSRAQSEAPVADDDARKGYSVGVFVNNDEASDTAYLGVQLEEETEHPEGGARVTHVVDGSPADEAGIRAGDIIVEFDGRVIRGPVGLTRRIHDSSPGDRAAIVVVRDGRQQRLEAELDERANTYRTYLTPFGDVAEVLVDPRLGKDFAKQLEELERLKGIDATELSERFGQLFEKQIPFVVPQVLDCDEEDDCMYFGFRAQGRPLLGVQLVETTRELRRHLGGSEDAGVLVSKVLSGTPARQADIRVGDLIVSIAGEPVKSSADIRRELEDKRGETFDVEVIRDNESMRIEITILEDQDRPTGPRAFLAPPHASGPVAIAPVAVPAIAPVAVPAIAAPPAPVVVAPDIPAMPAPPVPVLAPDVRVPSVRNQERRALRGRPALV